MIGDAVTEGVGLASAHSDWTVACLIGVPAALGIVRGNFRGKALLLALFRAPLQIPGVVSGVAFLTVEGGPGEADDISLYLPKLKRVRKVALDVWVGAQGKPYGYRVETLGPVNSPRLLYRVWAKDGHEELVRGAVFSELDVRSLRNNVIAAGDDPLLSNRVASFPTTIVSPSVLFDELEVKRADTSKDKLPDYPPPPLSAPRAATSLTTPH